MRLKEINQVILVWGAISSLGIDELRDKGSPVVVPENRPYLLGLRHNIPFLRREGIEGIYCPDSALGVLLYRGKVKKAVLFHKGARKEGVIGVCGSLYFALLSKTHNIPIKAVPGEKVDYCPWDKDASTLNNQTFIEERESGDLVVTAQDELIDWEMLS